VSKPTARQLPNFARFSAIGPSYGQMKFMTTAKAVSDKTKNSPIVIKTCTAESLGLRPVIAS
jgi:hypothetical protein